MRADGTPIIVREGTSSALQRERIGGKEGRHDEQWLQQLIHRHPTCIPMDQIEPGLPELVPVCMELPLPSGYLDNLLMTPEGDIVIVEVKLFHNPQARREVVAQALDYASSLFRMNYDQLEKAVLQADFDGGEKPSRLYDQFGDADTLDEPGYVDAVNMNLRNGRIVVLVIGDGIRSDAEDLTDGLQSHAGFHFTFALIELAVFQGLSEDDLLVVPRTLTKTCMIDRGIVRIDDQRSEVIAVPESMQAATSSQRQSITSEQFFEVMSARDANLPDELKGFIAKLSTLGVYPEFRQSLMFKWAAPSGRAVNLGYIMKDGKWWTDVTRWKDGDPSMAHQYVEDLAESFDGEVRVKDSGSRYVIFNGETPYIETLMDKQDGWIAAIEQFQNRIRQEFASGELE
jgi:hypothetical protein